MCNFRLPGGAVVPKGELSNLICQLGFLSFSINQPANVEYTDICPEIVQYDSTRVIQGPCKPSLSWYACKRFQYTQRDGVDPLASSSTKGRCMSLGMASLTTLLKSMRDLHAGNKPVLDAVTTTTADIENVTLRPDQAIYRHSIFESVLRVLPLHLSRLFSHCLYKCPDVCCD